MREGNNPGDAQVVANSCDVDAKDEAHSPTTKRTVGLSNGTTAWDDSSAYSTGSRSTMLLSPNSPRNPIHHVPNLSEAFLNHEDSPSPNHKKIFWSPRLSRGSYQTVGENPSLGSSDGDSKDVGTELAAFMAQYSDALDLADDDPAVAALEKSASTLTTVDETQNTDGQNSGSRSPIVCDTCVEVQKKFHKKRHSKDPGILWVTDGSKSSKPHLELNVSFLMNGGEEIVSDTPSTQGKSIARTGRRQARRQRGRPQTKSYNDINNNSQKDPVGTNPQSVRHLKDLSDRPDEDLESSMSSFSESPIMTQSHRTRHASAQDFWRYLEERETGHASFPQPSRLNHRGRLQQIRGLVKQRTKKSIETRDEFLNETSNKSLTSPMGPRLTLQNIELVKQMSTKKVSLEEM